jgi:nicotinamidase-related amidase
MVVDMQNDFCSEQGFYGRRGMPIPPVRRAIESLVRLRDSLRDKGVIVIYTRLVHDPAEADIHERHRILPSRWVGDDRRLEPGTWGAEIIDELTPRPDEAVFVKGDYSAFFATGLEPYLRRRGVRTLVLTGTVDYACVLHTAFDAFCRDFDVLVPRDCVSGWYPDLGQAALRMVELLIGRVVSEPELLDLVVTRQP